MADGFHSDRFYAERRSCIGGSDAAAIIGASRWASRLSVYLDKIGESEPTPMSSRMEWGLRLESAIANWYSDETGHAVVRQGFRRRRGHPWMGGHIDRLRDDGRLVEIKTADRLDDAWGEPGSDKVPADYWTQVQHYLAVVGGSVADLVVLVRGNTPSIFTIERDLAFTELLTEQERAFWNDHVIPRVPPEPDGSEASKAALAALYPRSSDESIVATPEDTERIRLLLELKEQAKSLEASITEAENAVKGQMGPAPRMVGDGVWASWSERKGGVSWKLIAAGYRRTLEKVRDLIRSGGLDTAEEMTSVDFDAFEGLYRAEPSRVFTVGKREES